MPAQTGVFAVRLQGGLDPASVGAKATHLVKTMEMGLPVPPGGVVTRQALRLFLEQTGLLARAQRLIGEDGLDEAARTMEYEAFCDEMLKAPIPQPVIEAVGPIARALLVDSPHGLAVRSAGVHEDSAKASFAGVYESFLGIRSEADLWLAIRRCWCASWAPNAVDYARRMGIRPAVDGMGVLLQRLVYADSAGVLFTADPLTGNPWRFVLESSFGLARDWVASAGTMPVDRFLFEWDSCEITGREVAPKKTALFPGAGGIDTIDLPLELQSVPSLTDELAMRVARAGLQIDRAFAARVDVEWVVDGDEIHIVQVRPITALPPFFAHRLPAHLADRTWRPAKQWHYPLRDGDGTVTLPIYRDKLITEKFNRYLQVGPVETPVHRMCGAEMDFHGHRYLVQEDEVWPPWPRIPVSQQEHYLIEYEPRMRADFLHDSTTRFPDVEQKAGRLEKEAKTLGQAIDAILWVQEELWDLAAVGHGPSQHLSQICRGLLSAFTEEHLPGVDVDDLLQGHHADLDPYWPHTLMEEAERMARLLEPEGTRFAGLSLEAMIGVLEEGEAPASFLMALEACCDRLCLVPPWEFHRLGEAPYERGTRRQVREILRLVRSALRGAPPVARVVEETRRGREAAVARARRILGGFSDDFDRLHDWALFWGPALNHRLSQDVPGRKLHRLFRSVRQVLLAAGLVDDVDDVVYFTVEDLEVIAAAGDIAAGRRVLQKRKLDYERSGRLVVPPFLGKAPGEGSPVEAGAAPGVGEAGAGAVIIGKSAGPGRREGVVRRIRTLGEGDDVAGEEDVVVLLNPERANNNHVQLLFSVMLRVRGLVVPDARGMWTGHMSQIARECRVPVVSVLPSDLARLTEGCPVEIDGTRGTLTLIDA